MALGDVAAAENAYRQAIASPIQMPGGDHGIWIAWPDCCPGSDVPVKHCHTRKRRCI